MTYKNQIAMLATAILIFTIQSCKKDSPPKPVTQISFSTYALDYIQLSKGKYFIYKDSATAATDSVMVTYSVLENTYYPATTGSWFNLPDYYAQNYKLTLSKISSTGSSTLWFDGYSTASVIFFPFSVDTAAVNLYGGEINISALVFAHTHSERSTQTFTFEGNTYQNVVVTVNDNGLGINDPNYRKTIYYWAKGAGIIKRTIITTGGKVQTSTLLRHN